jgi:RNA polymerase sigma factor (sigma-70 family)
MLLSRSESASDLAGAAFREHAGELQRFLARRVAQPQDADDLAQEVFARLLRVRNADLVRNPLSYLLGIATHVVREFRQRKQHERVLFDSDLADGHAECGDEAVQSMTDQLELRERLDRALKHLPAAHQLVLLLVKRDGLSYAEAASASGFSVHTIEKYVVEARARLRVLLAEAP